MLRKMIVLLAILLVTSSILLPSTESQARGWEWVKRLPISQFGPEDTAIFHAHVDQALEEAKDGERVKWRNPDSGSSGTITPLTSERLNGKLCRQTRFENQTDQDPDPDPDQNISEFLLCQQPDGSWSIESR